MPFEKKGSKRFAQRWDAWPQSGKSVAFFTFLIMLCLVFAFKGALILLLYHFSADGFDRFTKSSVAIK